MKELLPVQAVHVVILAAGMGTRMRSKKAKVLHEAGGLPILEHVIRAARKLTTPDHITVVVGHQADRVKDAMQHHGVRFALQAEQLGTGHALRCARDEGNPGAAYTVVLYGDTPLLTARTIENLVNQQRTSDAVATLITTILPDPTGYGRILRAGDGSVRAIVEQKAASPEQLLIQEINSGIYCFRSAELWRELTKLKPNPASGEIYLTDLVETFSSQGLRVARYLLEDPQELAGINHRVQLAEADALLRRRKVEELMLSGVTIEKPETVTIDPDVVIGQDTIIGPHTLLLGRTVIGEDCRVGASCLIENATLEDRVTIKPFTMIQDSVFRRGSDAGPFARLRQNNDVGEGAHIGNFVELKNATLGAGVKAGHLTYLGDASLGPKTNVGAGTITCNYDGVNKHRTNIGEGVFIGSNSTLVAPITLHDGSYTAAGSTVTHDAPADSLVVGRARQEIKHEWAKRRRELSKKP